MINQNVTLANAKRLPEFILSEVEGVVHTVPASLRENDMDT
jgi:hypothetical protein